MSEFIFKTPTTKREMKSMILHTLGELDVNSVVLNGYSIVAKDWDSDSTENVDQPFYIYIGDTETRVMYSLDGITTYHENEIFDFNIVDDKLETSKIEDFEMNMISFNQKLLELYPECDFDLAANKIPVLESVMILSEDNKIVAKARFSDGYCKIAELSQDEKRVIYNNKEKYLNWKYQEI